MKTTIRSTIIAANLLTATGLCAIIPVHVSEKLAQHYRETGNYQQEALQRISNEQVDRTRQERNKPWRSFPAHVLRKKCMELAWAIQIGITAKAIYLRYFPG